MDVKKKKVLPRTRIGIFILILPDCLVLCLHIVIPTEDMIMDVFPSHSGHDWIGVSGMLGI